MNKYGSETRKHPGRKGEGTRFEKEGGGTQRSKQWSSLNISSQALPSREKGT